MATQEPQAQHVRMIETHAVTAVALPDDRLLLTLDDGRSFVIDGDRLSPREDGTYQMELVAADIARLALSAEPSGAIMRPLVGTRYRIALQERLQDDVGEGSDLSDAASGEGNVERGI